MLSSRIRFEPGTGNRFGEAASSFSGIGVRAAFQEAEQRAKEREAKERGEDVKPAPEPPSDTKDAPRGRDRLDCGQQTRV